ncbi:MAG: EamA family transporter [Ornithinimicrobium sp.]|uniref:DMT family transporter n=1 Tax=Ornithinimicrobium sp. TaxID=1977084 RepID=UPI0026E02CBC|nr:EamA family transporter [Ornithinimicrobium sp.]MDO5739385.1 EamA family transporter [Ornithinimicrobium sp.]
MNRGSQPVAGAALAAVGAAALWGTTGTAQALGPDASDPTSVGAARIILGALVLVVLAWLESHRAERPVRNAAEPVGGTSVPASWLDPTVALGRLPRLVLVLLGGIAVAAYQACFFLGVARAGVAVGTVVALGVAPLATGLLGMLLGERPTARWATATAGAVVGVLLLVAGSGTLEDGSGVAVGIAAALGAGLSYAGYTIAARALLLRGVSGMVVMAGLFAVGALLLAPTLLVADLGWLSTRSGLLMVLWLGVIATGLSYVLFQRGLSGLPASTVASLSLAEPVTATLLGVVVLGEHLSALTLTGILVVALSLLLMALRRKTTPVAPEPV